MAARRQHLSMDHLEDRSLMAANFPTGVLSGPEAGQPLNIALQYLATNGADNGVSPGDISRLVVTDQYTDTVGAKATHIYLRQGYNGLSIDNANLSVTVMPDGSILSVAGSFIPGVGQFASAGVPLPGMSASDALTAAAPALDLGGAFAPQIRSITDLADQTMTLVDPDLSLDPIPAKLRYVAADDGTLNLTWDFVIRTPDNQHWYDFSVDASAGTILRKADWVDEYSAKYNVYALPTKSPLYGDRTVLTDPANPAASPFGWQSTNSASTAEFTTSRGNNVDAYDDIANQDSPGTRADGGSSLNFDFPIDFTKQPSTYLPAAITSEFYLANEAHDLHYMYGFNEAAGNFQVNNFSNGGAGNDPVLAEAQDGGGTNNANFATPPDGQSPRMQMYIFNATDPNVDGDLDAEVVEHEYGHGVSTRLTGGPANSSSLDTNQSGGMGEGWSDFWALMFTQLPTDTQNTPRPVGAWLLGDAAGGPGIRRFSYSYDMTVNPQTIADYNTDTSFFGGPEVHNTGELWTDMLWDMNWNLINKYGFDPDLTKGYQSGGAGNLLALQLVMDGLKIQPANPTFIQARDAILSADIALNGGEDLPQIWDAFARRGLGLSASTTNSDSTVVVTGTDTPVFLTLGLNLPTGIVEHQPLTPTVIGTVFDPSSPGGPSQYQAKIDWGDGQIAFGTLVPTGVGKFNIVANKTYDQGGDYNVKVSLTKIGSVTVSSSAKITIGDLPIHAEASSIVTSEGTLFTGQVGTFNDTDPTPSPASSYQTTITWGDGTVSPGTVSQISFGHYAVSGSHLFHGGTRTTTLTVKGPGGSSASANGSAIVDDSPMQAFPTTISTVEGQSFTGLVATFTDADPSHPPVSYYTARIDWGDGTASAGTITALGSGSYGVIGTHVFTVGAIQATVIINDSDVSRATTTSTGNAANAPIFITPATLSVNEGFASNVLVGTFKDSNIVSKATDFRVNIDWGDNSSSPGLVVYNGLGNYVLTGKHAYTYRLEPYVTTLTLTEVKVVGQQTETVGTLISKGTANVTNAPLTANGSSFSAVEGQPISKSTLVSTFVDGNTTAVAGDYSARITWGNGQTSVGVVKATKVPGTFSVFAGDYTFPVAGSYSYLVEVKDNVGTPVDANGLATVTDAPLKPFGNFITAKEATSTGTVLAGSFFDQNPDSAINQFTATIAWGDGSSSPGTIVATDVTGLYRVVGSHTYANPGVYTHKVVVQSAQGSTTTAVGTTGVSDLILPLSGQLDPSSDVGASSTDGVTKAVQPVFTGHAQANSFIHLYARRTDSGDLVPVGTTTSDANGAWIVASSPLADGDYAFYAKATDANGRAGSLVTPLDVPGRGTLLVDTSSPTVSSVQFDPRFNTFHVTFNEPVSGMDLGGLLSGSNYTVLHNGRNASPSSIALDPNNANSVLVRFNLGRSRGIYQLTMNSLALDDLAGNVLNETFFVPFPGTPHSLGDNYVAQFNSNGRTSTGPQLVTPPNQLQAARQFSRFLRGRFRAFGR